MFSKARPITIVEKGECLPSTKAPLAIFCFISQQPTTLSGLLSAKLESSDRILVRLLINSHIITRATLSHDDSAMIIPPITFHGKYEVTCETVSGVVRSTNFAFYEHNQ